MALLALPAAGSQANSTTNSPRKEKKRKRKEKKDKGKGKEDKTEYDSDAELEISAEDLVAADGEGGGARKDEDGEGDDDEDDDVRARPSIVTEDVKEKAKRRREQTLLLRGVLDKEQEARFQTFYSTVINRSVVKKLNKDIYDQSMPNNLTAVVAGMVKIFVADVVETALDLQKESEHPEGPLQPYHLEMARIQLQKRGLLRPPTGSGGSEHSSTGLRPRKRMFRR